MTLRPLPWLALVLSALPASAAEAPAFTRHADRVVCLPERPGGFELPDFAWNGSRFVMTWYERSAAAPPKKKVVPPSPDPLSPPADRTRLKPGGRLPAPPPSRPEPPPLEASPTEGPPLMPPPRHGPRQAPPLPVEPPVSMSFEQKTALVEAAGDLIGASVHDVSAVDGFTSAMGRLAFTGAELGLAYEDDAAGERTAMFRKLDAKGVPRAPPIALTTDFLPHGDHLTLAWSAATEQWGVLFGGTFGKGSVTHHVFLSRFRGSSPGAPLRLDDAESSDLPGVTSTLVAAGPCFLASWADSPNPHVTLGEVCGDGPVRRLNVNETPGVQPLQSTLALAGDTVLVAWVDRDAVQADLSADVRYTVATRGRDGPKATSHGRFTRKGWAQSPHALADGKSFWLTWNEGDDVWLAHLGLDGKLLEVETKVGQPAAGPTWSRLFSSGNALFVGVSSPNAQACKTSLVEVAGPR